MAPSSSVNSPPSLNSQLEKRRKKSTEKEKRRNVDMNKGYDELQRHLPVDQKNRLSKIKTLRITMRYIEHLNSILNGTNTADSMFGDSRPVTMNDFAMIAMNEMQVRNSYSERIQDELPLGKTTRGKSYSSASTSLSTSPMNTAQFPVTVPSMPVFGAHYLQPSVPQQPAFIPTTNNFNSIPNYINTFPTYAFNEHQMQSFESQNNHQQYPNYHNW